MRENVYIKIDDGNEKDYSLKERDQSYWVNEKLQIDGNRKHIKKDKPITNKSIIEMQMEQQKAEREKTQRNEEKRLMEECKKRVQQSEWTKIPSLNTVSNKTNVDIIKTIDDHLDAILDEVPINDDVEEMALPDAKEELVENIQIARPPIANINRQYANNDVPNIGAILSGLFGENGSDSMNLLMSLMNGITPEMIDQFVQSNPNIVNNLMGEMSGMSGMNVDDMMKRCYECKKEDE
jgi:hypothetical protein